MFDTLLAAFIISSNVTKPGGEAETNGLEEFIPVFVLFRYNIPNIRE